MKIRVITYAKINLYLDVIGRYSNGYHQIESVFQNVNLFDEVFIEEIPGDNEILFSSNEKSLPIDDSNLIVRAAKLLKVKFKVNKGVKIHLEKKIPIGGGLGGGSSNCAGVLAGLNLLWQLGLSTDELIELASLLGADVPFFLKGGTCAVGGIGNIVSKLPFLGGYCVVLISPGFSLSTRQVYTHPLLTVRRIRRKNNGFSYDFRKVLIKLYQGKWGGVLYNRLEEPAFALCPELRRVKDLVRNLGYKNVCMSGSGSTIFVVVESKNEGELLLNRLSGRWSTYLGEPVSVGYEVYCD